MANRIELEKSYIINDDDENRITLEKRRATYLSFNITI